MNIFNEIHLWFQPMHQELYIIFKLVLGFGTLLFVSRLLGKKELKQYTPFDFIFVVLLSGLLEETVYHHETPWFEFFIAIFVWALLSFIIEKLVQRFEKARPIIKGSPVMLIKRGNIIEDNLQKANLEFEQLRHALRSKGVFSLEEVDYAILETNGEVNVKRKPAYQTIKQGEAAGNHGEFPVMVIEQGRIVPSHVSGINEAWVKYDISRYGIEDIHQILYAERIGDRFYYKLKGRGENGEFDRKTN